MISLQSDCFFIAEFIVNPTHQELKFPIGKVGQILSEF